MEHGYNNTSTTEIVRLAGVLRGALGHHFSCKAELIPADVFEDYRVLDAYLGRVHGTVA